MYMYTCVYVYMYIYIYMYICVHVCGKAQTHIHQNMRSSFSQGPVGLGCEALGLAYKSRPSALASQGPRPWLTGYLPRRAMTSWQISCVVGSLEGKHPYIAWGFQIVHECLLPEIVFGPSLFAHATAWHFSMLIATIH